MNIIHILTVGTDHPSRIVPLGKMPAISKAFLVLPETDPEDPSDVAHEEHLKEKVLPGIYSVLGGMPYEEFRVDYYEFSRAFPQAMGITKMAKQQADAVYINVTSGTKIVSIAFFLAACIENVEAYFVIPDQFHIMMTDKIPEILHKYTDLNKLKSRMTELCDEWGMNFLSKGAKKIVYLPTPPLTGHDTRVRSLLVALDDMGGKSDSLETLVDYLESRKILPFDSKQSTRNFVSKLVGQLSDQKLLTREKEARITRIHLTDSGKMLAEVYRIMAKYEVEEASAATGHILN